jgi:hypothetical protein
MRATRILLLGIVLILVGFGVGTAQARKDTTTFEGRYDWSQRGGDELRADFRPDGKGHWTVAFRFRFNGREETWSGTAQGSLSDGSTLTGTARMGSRNWIFDAEIEDGVMRGSHREVKRSGREYTTGTFEISR